MAFEHARPEEMVHFKAAETKPRETANVGMNVANKKVAPAGSKNTNGIFLGVIALLAITTLFLFIAKNNLSAKNQMLQGQLDAATAAKVTLEQQLSEANAIKDDLQTKVEQMKKEAEAFASQIEEEKRLRESAVTQLNQKVQEINSLQAAIEAERQEKTALKESLGRETESLRTQLNEAKIAKESLEKKLKETLAKKGIKLEKIVVKPETGELVSEGQVLVVNKEFDFVVINLGENDGLKVGSKLQVFKDNDVLGTVEVEKIYGNMSAATMMPDVQKDKIKEGCSVKPI
jgi:F0F1-type ATP synthase membrane subunit b/b'